VGVPFGLSSVVVTSIRVLMDVGPRLVLVGIHGEILDHGDM
jgi:hypothetical protein